MASNEIRIPVLAEIQADHKSLLAVQKALENTLALAGKDTTFATNLRKSLAEIEPLIEKFGRIIMEPEIDKNALRELEHIAKKVFGTFDKTVEQGRFLDVSKMLSDEDLARIQEYTKQVAALGRELEKVRQHGAGGAASEWLAKPEVTKGSDVAARAAKSSIYKPAATLEQNVTSFTNAASVAAAKSADLAQRVVELTSAYETATKVTAQAQANLKMLEASVPAIQRRADTATFASAITRIKGATSAAQNMQANTPIKEIGATLYQFGDAGYIQASYRNLATRFFQALGMGVEQATSLAASQIDRDIVPALQRHFGIDETNMRSYVVDNGPMLSQLREAGAIFGEILRNELTQARAAGMGSDVEGITDYAKKKQGELASARSAVKKARTAENEAFEEWAGAEEAQKQAQDLNIELTSLATALREAAAAAKTLKETQLKADQDAAKRRVTDAEDKERERVMAPVKTHAPQAGKDEKVGDENRGNMGDLLRQGENAKAEAEDFKKSMQNAVKQWFSVQQIINIVKQGIRQAYQDIQGLDKAMTNIAVVTDMSVSDLWGKINDYMGIAQQYGVTTQGVYEVSQLYYQQGLSTNEVMEATTETLKMARIAGMGYAEAADAMTVAIRAFKMEMSDTGHVTDVYSKVAAVTASDTEELAIAMSKTASSAESVGSSFENTTAMLAVMIETTRESAQNLGSALKSIISRYGEMKQGLTQDSDGEIIDYNKTDAALRSIGISIKDAQGQFRDFDDVIFELSSKWDGLDKNTQRYIATIMAGNRQQSRFIALVDNWERLDEVASSAQDSEDAGLLQYAKTLDSLESKLNNLKTSFQQFYMSIFNGEFFKGAVDIINNFVQSLTRMGPILGSINLLQLINQIKLVGQLLINTFSKSIQKVRNANKAWQDAFTGGWTPVGEKIANALAEAILNKATLVGKEFVKKAENGVEQAATNPSQPNTQTPQESPQATAQQQVYSSKALGKASQVLHTWSPLSASVLGKYGAVQDRPSMLGNLDEINEAYQKQADIILASGDKFGESAKKWAEAVKAAGEKFGKDVDEAAKREGLKELNTADLEAQKELAAAEQEIAKRKAAGVRQQVGSGAMAVGTALTSAGMLMNQSTMQGYDTSTALQGAGGALSAIGQAATGNYVGAAITAITTVVTTFQRISERAKAELENAAKAVESANAERAEKKEELRSLSDYAKKLKEVEAARFDSNEAEEEWLNLNNEIAEKYPELINYIDSEGNSIVNLTADYNGLTTARLEAAEATALYYREQQKLYKLKAVAAKESTAKEITTSPWDVHSVLFYGNTDTQEAFHRAYGRLFEQTEEGNITLKSGSSYISDLARLHEIDALDDFILRTFGLTEEEMLSLLDSWSGDEPALSAEFNSDISAQTGLTLIRRLLAEGYQPGNYFGSHTERDQPFTIRGIKKLLGNELMPDEEAAAILEEYETEGISAIISRGVGLYDLIQAASSGDLELAQIARSIGTSAGVLEYSSETNSWGLSSNQDKIQQWKDVEQYAMLSESNARAWASSEGAIYLYNTAAQETLTAINGYEEILLNRAIILAGGADKLGRFIEGGTRVDGQLITLEDVYTTYAEEVATWYSGLSSANQELLQSLLSSSTSYTLEEMQNSLGKMGLSESENPEIYKAIMQTWYTDNYTAKYRGMKAIWGDTIEVMSLDQWKASDRYGERQAGLTDEEAYYQYTQGILNQLETDDVDLKNILQTASLQQQNQFISWWKVQKELIEKSEGYAVNIINARLAEVTNATKQLLDEQDTILNLGESSLDISTLDQEARMTLFNLLTSENLGTSESIDEIINFLVSQGIVVDETVRKVLEDWVYENINTRIATLIDDVDNFAKQLSDLSSKQEKGLTFAESESYLKQLQKLRPNTNWNNYFQIDEKGLITFIDFGASLKELYQAQIEQYNNETKYLNNHILKSLGFNEETNIFGSSSLDSVLEDTDLANILNYAGEGISAAEEDLRNALKQANFKDSDIDFIIQQIKSGHFKTKEDIDNYFKELSANITSGTDYLIAQYQASLQDLGFTNATKAYTDNTQIKNLLEGGSIADLRNLWLKNLDDNTSVTVDGKALEYKSGKWDDRYWEQYYTNKMSELQGAHFDAYGQLIITDYIAYAEYIAALQNWSEEDDAYKNLMQNARSAQISAQEAASVGIQTGLEELYTAAIQEQEISWSEISNIMSAANLGTETQAEILTAYENAKRQGVAGYVAFIDYLTKTIQENSNGNGLDLAALQATKKDAQNALVSSLVSSLEQGFKGTLSNADFNALIEQIGRAPKEYRRYVTETYDGLRLSAEGALVIASKLIDKFGNTSLVAESLVEQLGGSGALGSYKDVDDLINEIVTNTNHWAHGNEDVLNLLYQMRAQYSQLAKDARFDFMNQDHFEGAADNWYTLTDSISTAINKLKSAFEKGGKIDYKSFDNIITWISDLSVDGLDTRLGETSVTLGQFTDAVLATVDATGNLDLSAAAANLGISMDDMAGALEGGLQEVAEQQVAYWKKYLDFLKGLKRLQDAQAEVQLEIPIKNEATGKWTYKGNTYDSWEALAAVYAGDVAAAQQYFESFSYTGANGTTITLSGENNPLNFILGQIGAFDSEGNLALKEGMAAQIGQYMAQVYAWIDTISEKDIDYYINKDTGEITIPWSEILQIELDTSTTPEANTTNAEEAGEQTQEAAEGAAESALTASGATPNGDGSYTYTLDGMTLKIQMGANGSVEIDLTNATGTLPTAAELRKVFEGKPGFSATDDNNWVFTDSNLGFSIKCSNGTLSFDTSGMTPPAAPTAAELSAILGTTWTTADGGKTYTTNLNGVSFVYNSATGKININASSFQLAGGLDATSLAAILGGTWTTNDNGATYTATIAGTSFVYESSSGLVKIDGSKFTLSGGLSATELATILGGTWSSSDNGATYESAINGVTFTYKSASGTVEIDSSTFTLSAGLSAEQLTALLGGTWSTEDGITYKSVINGVTFTYESTTGTINVDPSGFTVSANLTADQLKTLLGSSWTSEDGITYKSTINGVTFTYESTTGKLVVTPPTTATEPANTDFITLMQAQGWTYENGVYTKDFGGGTLTYNATAGALNITPSATMAAANPDMATLLDSAFGAGGWQPNENGGYDILNATTGEVLYTIPAKVTIIPTEGSNVGQGDNGLTADVDVTLTPNTEKIDSVLSGYEQKTINLTIDIDKNSLIKSSQHFETAWNTLPKVKNQGAFDFGSQDKNLAEESFNYLVTEASELSETNKLTQEDVALIKALGNAMNDAGINVDAAMETVEELSTAEENTVLIDLAAFAEAFNGANLFGNLTALTALLTAMNNPAVVSLDLTGFITQLQFMSELELDDEEINNFVTAITALTTAITALPTEIDVSVKVSAGNSYNIIDSIKNALDGIKDKTVTIVTQHVDSGSDKNHGAPTSANYAGNVSGLALAKGNATDKLLIGAHLAGKTLVGELGPELAVYDNQYHLLGRNGAEFVDLPNDAIVFNHRQTAGIIKGQVGYRGQALASGNVTGPAAAGGIDAAIGAVEKIIKLWSNIADATVKDLVSAGGGGGGNSLKATTADLEEWYNLMRQIEQIEQEITNLEAKRANIYDGSDYLKNLRETQKLLEKQRLTQQRLYEYQKKQLQAQADFINQHKIWSKFLTVGEDGLLQYIKGNEQVGGKGAIEVLEKLNKMSGAEQEKFVKSLEYTAKDEEGKVLEGEKLVARFYEELQDQIDQYKELYETVHTTEAELEDLTSQIEKVNKEIIENQKELETGIYDIIVGAWEKEIELLEEQAKLVKEANKAYTDGLKKALGAERDLYEENKSTEERESLQRQLALLRRSGGSASEIADLEEQLDDALKDEYFKTQEKMIENIEDANERQVKKLEEQITLQKEALEYEKDNGVIWTKVYDVLRGSQESILAFMQGNSTEFFSKSALEQKEMLLDWAKKIGIYSEDQQYKTAMAEAEKHWNSEAMWSGEVLSGLQGNYESLSDEQKAYMAEYFKKSYSDARLDGSTEAKAQRIAEENIKKSLTEGGAGTGIEDMGGGSGGSGSDYKRVYYGGYTNTLQFIGGKDCYADGLKKAKELAKGKGIEVDKGDNWFKTGSSPIEPWRKLWRAVSAQHGELARYETEAEAKKAIERRQLDLSLKRSKKLPMTLEDTFWEDATAKFYSTGGLVDYTGLAMVHGSKSKPEAFLNAAQTAQIKEALQATHGKENLLEGLHSTIAELRSLIHNISTINNSTNYEVSIAPGAVVINVDELANSYDVEELSADIMNRMAAIASKATNRGVSRR